MRCLAQGGDLPLRLLVGLVLGLLLLRAGHVLGQQPISGIPSNCVCTSRNLRAAVGRHFGRGQLDPVGVDLHRLAGRIFRVAAVIEGGRSGVGRRLRMDSSRNLQGQAEMVRVGEEQHAQRLVFTAWPATGTPRIVSFTSVYSGFCGGIKRLSKVWLTTTRIFALR